MLMECNGCNMSVEQASEGGSLGTGNSLAIGLGTGSVIMMVVLVAIVYTVKRRMSKR